MVVLQHFQRLLPASGVALFARTGLGAVAVAVFFMVSGFVVAEANAVFYRGRPGSFLLNRLIRVVPPYLAALMFSVSVHAVLWHAGLLELWDYRLHGSPLDPALLVSGVAGLLPGFSTRMLGQDFEFIPYVWSLRMEMAFYLCATAALALGGSWRHAVPAALALTVAASAAFLLEMRPGALSTAPMFLFGVAIYLAVTPGPEPRIGFDRLRRPLLLVASCGLAAAGFVSWRQHGTPVLAWQLAMLACLSAVFVRLATMRPSASSMTLDKMLGSLSYPLYLNHYAVGIAVYNLTAARGPAVFAATIAASVLLSWLMAQLAEAPFRRLRNRVRQTVL